jgi:hypothetical protein
VKTDGSPAAVCRANRRRRGFPGITEVGGQSGEGLLRRRWGQELTPQLPCYLGAAGLSAARSVDQRRSPAGGGRFGEGMGGEEVGACAPARGRWMRAWGKDRCRVRAASWAVALADRGSDHGSTGQWGVGRHGYFFARSGPTCD